MIPPRAKSYGPNVDMPEGPGPNGKKLYVFGEMHPGGVYTALITNLVNTVKDEVVSYSSEKREGKIMEFGQKLRRMNAHSTQQIQTALQEEEIVQAYAQALDDALRRLIIIASPHLKTYQYNRFEEYRIIAKEATHRMLVHEQTLLERLQPEYVYWEGHSTFELPLPIYAQRNGIRNIFLDQDAELHEQIVHVNDGPVYHTLQKKRERGWVAHIVPGDHTALLVAGLEHVRGTWGLMDLLEKNNIPAQRIDTHLSEQITQRVLHII